MKKSILFSKCTFIILFGLGVATQLNAQNTFPGSGTGAIPDGGGDTACGVNGAPLDVIFNVTGLTNTITSVEVDITITHSYIGDVTATLIAPDGVTSLVLFGRTGAASPIACGNSSDLGATYLFTDTAIGDNWWVANGTAGSYRTTEVGPQDTTTFSPETSLNDTFGGMTNVNGMWILRFNDAGAGDTGTVSVANLTIETNECVVDIPDATFKAYLIGNPAINTNGNNEIECGEAQAFTGEIDCNSMGITDLTGIEAFVNLTALDCAANLLTTLDVSNNIALINLLCHNNLLTTLDVSNNLVLRNLWCHYNLLTTLDVSNNTALEYLYCQSNLLSTLDVSNNTTLIHLTCNNNQLTSLDVQNGNNTNLSVFYAFNNPNLLCIQVDDAAWSTTNWTSIDNVASFNENCSLSVNNPVALTTISVYPNPTTNMLYFSTSETIKNVSIVDMLGKIVYQSDYNHSEINIDTSGWQQAIYLVKITTESQIKVVKISKN